MAQDTGNPTVQTHRRRTVLRGVVAGAASVVAAGAVLAACGDEAAPTATIAPAPAPTSAPVPTARLAASVVAATTAPVAAAAVATAPGATAAPTAAPVAAVATATSDPRPATTAGAPATSAVGPAAMASADGKIPGGAPGIPDAYTKPVAPFRAVAAVPGRGGKVTTFQIAETAPVPPRDQNPYWQELEKRLGVTVEPTFGPTSSWAEKSATVIAGGDLPDLYWLYPQDSRANDQYRTIQQGAFTDLTPLLTGNALKEWPNLAAFPPEAWKNIAINGKLYGVPRPQALLVSTMIYRKDWADKLGIGPLRNADDFLNMMVAFGKGDPDGNGRADTFGLGAISPAQHLSFGVIRSMFRTPNGWRANPDGTLTNAIETPEYRQALAFARRLWEAGGYHPDAPTMTAAQGREGFDASRFGALQMAMSGLPGTGGRRALTKRLTPSAEVFGLIPPGHDGGTAVTQAGAGHVGFTGIPARVGRDRERVRELLRILDYLAAPFGSEERVFLASGIEGVHHTVRPDGVRVLNDKGRAEIGDLANLTFAPTVFSYLENPGESEYMQRFYREFSALAVDNPTTALYAPTLGMRGPQLNQLVTDRETAFITGREPLTGVDEFIRDWRSRGGDQLRKEYQDALKGQ